MSNSSGDKEMNEMEELDKILVKYNLLGYGPKACGSFTSRKGVEDFLSWHSRHRVKVGREQVDRVLAEYIPRDRYISGLTDDLLSLLNSEKVWCEHIKLCDGYSSGWIFVNDQGASVSKWTVCPICGKERPKNE